MQGLESAGDEKTLQQSLKSAATLTLGSFSHGALEDLGGMEVKQSFWLVFRHMYSIFRDDSFKLCSKIAGVLGKHAWGSWGACKDHKIWNLPRPLL